MASTNTVLFILFSATAASAYNVSQTIRESWVRYASPYYSECICESGADMTKSINLLGKLEYPNDACLKCFMKCIQIKLGLMLSDGTIVTEVWIQGVAGVTPEMARNCNNFTSRMWDTCEKAFEWSKCVVKALSHN